MKHLSFIFLLGLTPLSAQQNGIEQTSELHTVPAGDNFLRWHGHLGRSYFVQVSDTNNPLAKWSWAPIIESGNNEEISYEVDGTATKGFYRLQYTDQTASNLDAADFDGDGLTNLQEITPIYLSGHYIQSNPLNSDSDQDGLPDKWERDNGLDPTDNGSTDPNNGPNGDADHDGFTNLAENAAGTNPQDSSSNPPGTPLPGGAPQLVSEQLHYSNWRYGFNGFQDNAKKYLKSVSHIVTTYSDEDDTDADQTVTVTTDAKTGNVTYQRVGTPADTAAADYSDNDPWIVASDVSRSRSSTQAPPGISTTVSQTLSDEYTIPAFVSNVENWFPAYLNKFTVANRWVPSYLYIPLFHTHTAAISLTPEPSDPSPAMFYSIAKLRYKWKVNAAPNQTVHWLEVFTPKDNSTPIVENKSWAASPTGTESPVYEIDPTQKNGKKNGFYAVIPLEVKQKNMPNVGLAENSTDMASPYITTTIRGGGVAFITGQPAMPQLKASFPGLDANINVEWKLEIKTERTERGTKDDKNYPASGYKTLPGNQPWDIGAEFGTDFVGGKCKLFYKVAGGSEQTAEFFIRGKNPLDDDAKAYVNNHAKAATYSYAWAMVQHESRQGNRCYNQFNSGGDGPDNLERPNLTPPDGWGIAQLDKPLGVSASTTEVYDWKKNVDKFFLEMDEKQKTTNRFFNAVALAYPNDQDAANPPASYTVTGTSTAYSAKELSTMILYNGAGGTQSSTLNGTPYLNPWKFNPSENPKWTFQDNQEDYAFDVIHGEVEETYEVEE